MISTHYWRNAKRENDLIKSSRLKLKVSFIFSAKIEKQFIFNEELKK